MFSDEKMFTMDAEVNCCKGRFLAPSTVEVKGIFGTKHPAQIMMFGAVAPDGKKMAPYFSRLERK